MRCVLAVKRTALAAGGAALARLAPRRMHRAHAEHARTLRAVRTALRMAGVSFSEVRPHALGPSGRSALRRAHLVICVGGDGTLLAASHHVGPGVVLGVNSAPRDSVGHFCATDRHRFPRVLRDLIRGSLRPRPVSRLEVSLDGQVWQGRILNDVLVCHESPAATTRYEIAVGVRREVHRSSGLWVATAAGSTAAIRSAGGVVLPLRSRLLQFRVRELYREPGRVYRLTRGLLARRALTVVSRMPEGRLYADGARLTRRFPFGMPASFRIGDEPLRLVSRSTTGGNP